MVTIIPAETNAHIDTLAQLYEAMALYRSLGFKKRDPYYHNPLPGVVYWELDLTNKAIIIQKNSMPNDL